MALLELPLLRGVLGFPGDDETALSANLNALRGDVIPEGIDAHLLRFVGSLADKTGKPPTFALAYQHYQSLMAGGDANGLSGLARLDDLKQAGLPMLDAVQYRYQLDTFKDTILSDGIGVLLQKTSSIITTGYTYTPPKSKPITLKGAVDAVQFMEQGLAELTSQFKAEGLEGKLSDSSAVWSRYQQRVGKPSTAIPTGFREFDAYHVGMEAGDLVLVLGYTGQLKSTVTLNIAYRAAVQHGRNVALVWLEGSVRALQDSLVVLHCQHPRWGTGLTTVTYSRLQTGQLTKDEEDRVKAAIDDLATNPSYGQFLYKEPEKTLTVSEMFRWAEAQDRRYPLSLLAVDYLGHVNPSSGRSAIEESSFANMAVRETKQRAQAFRRGEGLTVVSPWQSNRQGFKDAEKNGGKYSLTALAWAPEAEKSADLIYYTYRDENMAATSQLQLGNLKARDRKLVMTPFTVYANPDMKVIEDIDPMKAHQALVAFS